MNFDPLMVAGILSFLAAALHIGVVIGGPRWYRFFGAGESMASGARLLPGMPYTKVVLSAITTIYLMRGLGGIIAPFVIDHPHIQQNSVAFWLWSSAICLVIGVFYLLGLLSIWTAI